MADSNGTARTRRDSGSRRATLRDVAALAQVDPSAVSRVVNNDPNLSISPETRNRILNAIEKLGYRPNMLARGLKMSRTWTIGFVVPDIGNPIYVPIVEGAQRRAEEHGYGIVIGSHRSGDTYHTFARLLQQGRVDGLLVASGTLHDDLIRNLADDRAGPVVLVNRRVEGFPCSVILDDEAGSGLATTHLLDQGHREVAALIGPADIDTSKRRKRGFLAAVRDRGAKGHVVSSKGWSAAEGYRATMRLLDRQPHVTAIFPSTLLMAVGALRAAQDRGVSIPHELSVVALHDSDIANYTSPPLTTVAMPTHDLGAAAVDVLLERMNGGSRNSVLVPGSGHLVQRKSVAPPGRAGHGVGR